MTKARFNKELLSGLISTAIGKGAALVGFKQPLTNSVASNVDQKLQEFVSIFDFMSAALIADVKAGTLLLDCTTAFQNASAVSNRIYFPAGKYRFNSTVTIAGSRGLVLKGAASSLLGGGLSYDGVTTLDFSNVPVNNDGLVLENFIGVTIQDMVIRKRNATGGAGYGLRMANGHDYKLDQVKVDTQTGAAGGGICLGGGNGATATFIGNLLNVKVIADTVGAGASAGIFQNFGTSVTASGCYVIGGYWRMFGMTYCTLNSCAVDVSKSYGYLIDGCSNITINSCGAEQAVKGGFYCSTTTTNVVFISPYGAANNTSADATIGDLIHLDSSAGAVNNITIINPTAVSPNAATVQSIFANAGTGVVDVYGENAGLLPRGINGHSTWLTTKLTRTGDREVQTWTPTLVGWTNSGTPTVTGRYVKKGNVVTFWVRVAPGTNISAIRTTSSITGLPFNNSAGIASMVDDNLVSYGSVTVGPTGIIYPQTSGVLTVAVTIMGTLVI